uniref:Uncharacterized protein n=1 Tax=Arundo donax TaxID=35708 RepID=A0A0A8ZHD0_ARUDO
MTTKHGCQMRHTTLTFLAGHPAN